MTKTHIIKIPARRGDHAKGIKDLDAVTAFLEDLGDGKGRLTLVCWGRAWSQYWGAMGEGRALADFLSGASTDYVVDKLMLPPGVITKRAERGEERWLTDIVEALKDRLRASKGGSA